MKRVRAATATLAFLLVATAACRPDGSPRDADEPRSGVVAFEGTIIEVARAAGALVVEDDQRRMWSVSMRGQPAILLDRAAPGSTNDLLTGLPVKVYGHAGTGDTIRPDSLRILDLPEIVLVRPRDGVALTRPLVIIEGHAIRGRQPSFRLLHGDEVLNEGRLRNEALGARRYGSFRREVALGRYDLTEPVRLEAWIEGSDDERVVRRVRFAENRLLQLYFPSRAADPERMRCDVVYPLSQQAPVLLPPRRVVEALIEGVPESERRRGVFSELSRFSGVRSVEIADQAAAVDLGPLSPGEELDECARATIKAQLEETMAATFGVESVEVTVEGRSL